MPVVNFAAGGVATPADAALMMQLGVDGVFVGSGIFKSGDPARRAAAIVKAVTHYQDAGILAEVSKDLGEPMVGTQHLADARSREDRGTRLVILAFSHQLATKQSPDAGCPGRTITAVAMT
jgi:pyridoxal biosynthesis lyase PdxS